MRYPTAAAATAATAATGRRRREQCRETDVRAEDLAKEDAAQLAQVVVQGTALLRLWQIRLATAPAVGAGITHCPGTRPDAPGPQGVHLRPRCSLILQAVPLQQALQPSVRSGAVAVQTLLLPRPGG